ncbi:MAG: glycosyltransferase family 2 protein [Gammaproteobacteria bacterium]|jgi:glycosyltransferase involved in cell wall biosynthesis
MKLIIQIPCFNEQQTLPATLADLPSEVEGFDVTEYLVIDDGSTDKTVEVAREHGVHHVVELVQNRGLARAFMVGLEECLRRGADVIVNTDGDNQYRGDCIQSLVDPILAGETQIVVGARPISEIKTFSPIKKLLQYLGSWVVKIASGANIPDAPSGFRAYHHDAAMRLQVNNNYTYTLETIIQAGRMGIPMTSVPVSVNRVLRPSRLFRSSFEYVFRSVATILRVFVLYKPLKFFFLLAAIVSIPGLAGIARFLYFYYSEGGAGHIQSLVLSGVLVALGAILMAVGLLSDLISSNRRLLEDIRVRQIKLDLESRDK